MYPDETSKQWAMQPWNITKAPIEKEVKNVTINFGPQHPAAHGVLRLVLELDGEVCLSSYCQVNYLKFKENSYDLINSHYFCPHKQQLAIFFVGN